MFRPIITALALAAGLFAPPAVAAVRVTPAALEAAAPAPGIMPFVTPASDRRYDRRSDRRHRYDRRYDRRQNDWRHDRRRHAAPGYYYAPPRGDGPRYHRGQHLPRYVLINNPRRYGLTRYHRYARDNDHVYALDPNTGAVIALIGLVSTLLR
jgi:hypothetical protein